ncbi:hypothetical protein C1Y63_00960 [Corynebacterium sp. 13CS0277]|uniref:hypothetical protein n=1 Tax=Corynebacterium sp. 13CS0277 TaxID=2071994 RepID=UPI000D028450|nr:hypothetical protein [Corynebacterium sp. 13CS0277]PRQ12394.1 hypothetical protein C1Y63_00960 [Corynebacterium sp. 13CS0277]
MTTSLLAQAERGAQIGSEFGKASPVGLFIIVLLLAAVLYLGWSVNVRIKAMARRRQFAEDHGLDVFDIEAIDAAMKAEGVAPLKKPRMF